ncbi:MAG: aspartate-semialdehyde dehydrogenase [Proteobacteria bacterium]|nr:aspartate-semialdehyde dehydrogenase [Pseudomonadota bacterium]
MTGTIKIAVVGATGAVGREMLAELEDCKIENIELSLFASPRSAGEMLTFRNKSYEVKVFSLEALKGVTYCLMSAGGAFSKQHSQAIADQGTTVIDNSSAWRMNPNVPLVVPEVNADALKNWKNGIIANPNCSTIQMVVPLKALHQKFGIESVHVSTYQSVSGTGQKGIKELSGQVEGHFKYADLTPTVYAQPIAFNVLPAIDVLDKNGHCFEEEKMIRETRKIMSLPNLEVFATTARVPTFHCHSESVAVRLNQPVTRNQAIEALESQSGLVISKEDSHASFPTPRTVVGKSEIFVSRVRTPIDHEKSNWVQFWVVADNLRKGAATNAVQIAELLAL